MKKFDERKFMKQSLEISTFMVFLLFSFASAIVFLVMPILLNNFVSENDSMSLTNIGIIVIVLMVGYGIKALSIFVKNKLSQHYHVRASADIFREIFKLKYDKYLEMEPTSLQSRTFETIQAFSNLYFSTIPNLVINSLMFISVFIIALIFNPIVGIIMFLNLPFNYFGYKALNKKLSRLSLKMSYISSNAYKNENAVVSQIDFIKQNSNNETLLSLIKNHRNEAQDIARQVNNVANGASHIISAINQITHMGLVVYLTSLILLDHQLANGAVFIMMILPYF